MTRGDCSSHIINVIKTLMLDNHIKKFKIVKKIRYSCCKGTTSSLQYGTLQILPSFKKTPTLSKL